MIAFRSLIRTHIKDSDLTHRGSRSRRRFALSIALSALILIGSLISFGGIAVQAAPKPTPTRTLSPTPQRGTRQISYPSDGALVFGVVSIVGTASSPNLQNYQLQWLASSDPRAQWQLIVGPITQQVNGGVLGQWDTTKVADGTYQIRLRLTLQDGSTQDTYVPHVIVSNQQPTALPAAATAPGVTAIPTAGPSPTPLIQQPPTATTNPTFAALAANNNNSPTASGIDLGGAPIVPALIGGVTITGVGFVLGGIYTTARVQRRQRRKRRGFVR